MRRLALIRSLKTLVGLTLIGITSLATLLGCAGTHRARNVEPSGFLKDYAQLQPGGDDEALLLFIDPKADFRRYTKIQMDPIRVYTGEEDSPLRTMSPEDLKKLLDYFDASIRTALGDHYTFVTKPGPDVMHFRIALTEARSARVPLDVISSVMPPAVAINMLKTVATGKGTGLGEASMEFEALDSLSNKRLAAAVDRRVGAKYTGKFDKFSKWRTPKAAFDYWSARLSERLVELRNPAPAPAK